MMSRNQARLFVAVCLAVGASAPAGAARAEESLGWVEKASEGFISLAYGPLDPAKVPLFLLSCFDAMGIAVLAIHTQIDGVKPGEALTIDLAAGEVNAKLDCEAARDEGNG